MALQTETIVQPSAPNPGVIDIDTDFADTDGDSVNSIGGGSSFGTSLSSSILEYRYENGRRYHGYRNGSYMLPNDEAEQERLELHHHIFRLVLGGRLFRAPITAKPKRVLDFGTATGAWAMDFADEFQSATVIGNDLSPIQPSWVPPNCKFYVDDVESEWVYTPNEAFDFIHARGMGGSIKDWNMLYNRALQHLKPGGWIEMQEYEAWVSSDDDPTLKKCPNTARWLALIDEASIKFGKRMNVAREQKQHLIDAGFKDVRDDVYKVPMGTWPKDPKLKEMGAFQMEHMCNCIESFSLALFTRILGWKMDETQLLCNAVRKEFRDPKNHLLTTFHFVYGQRPTS
ncbi:methyltransferase [Histoplasma capsulatum var. duboisii H88]|uniref:Methyltransferase n=2 Tax=Ajellomyces capsulatus TaxID=5037 RepID=F0USI6_AJEC8|nr:methyltransferase [Histoplasma capsulatum H143]EGC48862.1 methyltransferase [Histoplasma capsulatum var. duboisii H88]QSS54464.1 methyltransferase [Histoplasma capsulatum var. duboisii H88]